MQSPSSRKFCRVLLMALVLWLVHSNAGISLLSAASRPSLLDERKMIKIEGRPRIVLGLYENPKEDAVLLQAVDAGFNLFQCGPDTASLDRLQRHGVKAWVNLGGSLDLSSDVPENRRKLAETIQHVGSHPALLLWEGPDEILWNNWWVPLETFRAELKEMGRMSRGNSVLEASFNKLRDLFERGLYVEAERLRSEFWRLAGKALPNPNLKVSDAPDRIRIGGMGVTLGIRAVRELDRGRHLIWMNHAPRNSLLDLRLYNEAADVVGCDIYPAPANLNVGHSDLDDMSLASVGAYTRRMQLASPGRSCAMVLQGFGWRDLREKSDEHQVAVGLGRRPTFLETRFMAYNAILHGANAILYWGTAYMKPVEDDGTPVQGRPRLWKDLLEVAREIRAIEPALLAAEVKGPRIRLAPTFGSRDEEGICWSLRRVGEDYVLVVANETRDGLSFTVEGLPAKLDGRTLYRLRTEETVLVNRGRMSDGIRAYDVHVYSTSKRFEKLDSSR